MKSKFILIFSLVGFLLLNLFSAQLGIDAYTRQVLIFIGINIVLASGFNLVIGHTGQFSLGHAGFMAIGAYASAAFSLFVSKDLLLQTGNPFFLEHGLFLLALIAGGLAAALAGLLVGIPCLRLRGDYLAIVTLGFGEIIRVIFQNMETLGGPRGLAGIPRMTDLFWVFGCASVTIYVVHALIRSVYGRGFLCTRDDEIAAEAMGVNTTKYKVLAFVLSAFFVGIGGALYAHSVRFITPEAFSFQKSVEILVMVIFGGLGNLAGGVFAAIFLTWLNEILRDVQEWRMVFYALLLIIIMILRPGGLLGTPAEVRRLLRKVGIMRPDTREADTQPLPVPTPSDSFSPDSPTSDPSTALPEPTDLPATALPAEPLLELREVTVRFGGLTAVHKVNLEVGNGELIGLIGPNGAGKTTAFNLITGVYKPSSGSVYFAGKKISGKRPYHITGRGIARTFQNIRLFSSLTVYENIRAACQIHLRHGISHALWRGRAFRREEARVQAIAEELLGIFGLQHLHDQECTSLSYGDQRRLEIVRALATRPRLLLLDEPAAGMNPTEKEELMRLIRFTQQRFQLSVLLVEHDMQVVMGICKRIYVLDHGLCIAQGSPHEIRNNPRVIEAYLGDSLDPVTPSPPC